MRFPGHETTPVGVDGLPQGWVEELIGSTCDIRTGKKDANFGGKTGLYPFFTCAQEPIRSNSYSFDQEAIILAGNGDFNIKFYRGKFEAYQRTYVISSYDKSLLFVSFYALQRSMNELAAGASGSTIKFLTKGMIENISFLKPTQTILSAFNSIISGYFNQLENVKAILSKSLEIKEFLLPLLISGQIQIDA